MMGVVARQIVYMQRHQGVIDKTLEEFVDEIHIELADAAPYKFAIEHQPRASGDIQHHARQRFIQRHVSMTVATQTFLVAYSLIECLPQRDADVFNGVMGIDVQVAFGENVYIHQTMPGDLPSM